MFSLKLTFRTFRLWHALWGVRRRHSVQKTRCRQDRIGWRLSTKISPLPYKLKRIVGSNNFSAQFIKIISHYKKMAIKLMYCNRQHACWSTKSRLATLLSSLIARWWVGLQTLWWFRLKDLSIDEMVEDWCFGCLSGPPGFTCWISFAPVFSFIYCLVLIFALSPFYILIYMFKEVMHW